MIKFIQGNCIDKIKELKDNSIDCVVSSPPYFNLRDYQTAKWQGGDPNCNHSHGRNTRGGLTKKQKNNKGSFGDEAVKNNENCKLCGAKRIDEQFGLEKTYQEYIANTVKVFEAFKPKLKDTATIWWNIGDSYSSGSRKTTTLQTLRKPKSSEIAKSKQKYLDGLIVRPPIQKNIKEKDLIMIPNRVAIALQDAGWYIRSEIIWHKPNPMPESTKDRPTQCHEKMWLITKNKKYYYDADAVREPCQAETVRRMTLGNKGKIGKNKNSTGWKQLNHYWGSEQSIKDANKGRNRRNVWTVTTKPFKDAHFATFPKDLIEPCIKAGCPEKVCVKCGKPQIKEFYRKEKYNPGLGNQHTPKGTHKKIGGVYQKWLEENPPQIKIKPSCDCNADFVPGVVLDPFGGSGTTGIVAKSLNRQSILIELNPEYINIAKKRIDKELGIFS